MNFKNAFMFKGITEGTESGVRIHYRDGSYRDFFGDDVHNTRDEIAETSWGSMWLLGNVFADTFLHNYHVSVSAKSDMSMHTVYGSLENTPLPDYGAVKSVYRHWKLQPTPHLFVVLTFADHVLRMKTDDIRQVALLERYLDNYNRL